MLGSGFARLLFNSFIGHTLAGFILTGKDASQISVNVAQSERKWDVYSQSDPVIEISQIEL